MSTIIWTAENLQESMLPARRTLCAQDGGTLLINKDSNGRYSVACMLPTSGMTSESVPLEDANPQISSAMSAPPVSALSFNAPAPSNLSDVSKRDTDVMKLHPVVRKGVEKIQKKLDKENIPMRVFEGYRTPERQAHLYAQGRSRPGAKVTNADAWSSYHQYGLAADFVRHENGRWNWNDTTAQQKKEWRRYHEIARECGLEALSWEMPHVQILDVSLTELKNGHYPDGGDDDWVSNLTAMIARWPRADAPPVPIDASRPPMRSQPWPPVPAPGTPGSSEPNWHSMFGGDAWAFDNMGVYTRDYTGNLKTWRTPGAPITVQEVIAQFREPIWAAAAKYGIAPEIIVMTIATETSQYRRFGFTGPKTFRWEQGYTVNATGDPKLDGKERGDYSAGPMQIMGDTARWINDLTSLGYTNATDFKFFKNKPAAVPSKLGLYDAAISIDVGAAFIKHNLEKTSGNPLLVAAAYNAGGLYPSSENHWRIRCYGNHIDRAAEWYGDACFVLNA